MNSQEEIEEIIASRINDAINKGSDSIDLSRLGLIAFPEILKTAPNIKRLNIGDNPIRSIPEWLKNFHCLEVLDVKHCQIEELPDIFYELHKLTNLYLSNNKIKNLPHSLSQVNSLRIISASTNNLTHLPAWVFNLTHFNFDKNPVIDPPLEIYNRGTEAIKNYLKEKEKGVKKIYEAKLLIVGEPGAGKTSLMKKIIDENYKLQTNEESTLGIEIQPYLFSSDNTPQFRTNIWDFGGQEIYHSTHQFFLTKRSLYILLADNRAEDTDFNYWLQNIELLSDMSPLVIVLNEKQGRKKDINTSGMRERFKSLQQVFSFDLSKEKAELKKLTNYIKYAVQNLPHIGDELPTSWVEIRIKLEQKASTEPFITDKEYFEICESIGQIDINGALTLSEYFHDIGIFLHFQDNPLLKKTIFLKPDWATKAVYKILDDDQVINKNGYFSSYDVARLWNDKFLKLMKDELLALMMKFELCYPIDKNNFLVPQLLKRGKPNKNRLGEDFSIIKYNYDFMPKGIITRFIVRNSIYVENHDLVWREGVVLSRNGEDIAEVIETYGNREIVIRVSGEERKEFLAIILHEIDKINESYSNLKVKKLVPCNCRVCATLTNPYFFDYHRLKKFQNKGRKTDLCEESVEEVTIENLLHNALGKISIDGLNKKSVYISYAIENGEDKKLFDKFFSPLVKKLKLNVWSQDLIPPGDNIKAAINENIEKSDTIICLITQDYINNAAINDFEVERILKKNQNNECNIIPIVLRSCDQEENPFIELKSIEFNRAPVLSHHNSDEALTSVMQEIKLIFEKYFEVE
ncbi:COR domain-containing protein [Rufibacter latericius]|uniref:non-specific serine/threonine protein kinase n=1 Tax=Rufibacter latericius TaxID=2487040 RepID=A0A3M9M8E8_9BACT|nr:COR domain-containing protein [Rufibacter latericius]RNI21792.1 TIR domain-containing protein [Rufibacter latericius]